MGCNITVPVVGLWESPCDWEPREIRVEDVGGESRRIGLANIELASCRKIFVRIRLI